MPRARRSLTRWLRALTLRTFVLFAAAIVASIAFVLIANEVREGDADRIDTTIELAIHQLDSAIGDVIMKAASFIGSDVVVIPAIVLVAIVAIMKRKRHAAIIVVINAIVVSSANAVLKLMFSRQRPSLFDKIPRPNSYSFPSGHAMSAMGIIGVIAAVVITLYPRARTPVVVASSLLIVTIGFSRVYLGVHWPFDVLGGFAGGVPPLVVSLHLLHRSRQPTADRSLADLIEVKPADG